MYKNIRFLLTIVTRLEFGLEFWKQIVCSTIINGSYEL